MRLRNFAFALLLLTAPPLVAVLAALLLAFRQDPPETPPWMVLPFMAAVLFPFAFQMILRFRRTTFTVPVPDPEEPAWMRPSRQLALVPFAYLLLGAAALGYVVAGHGGKHMGLLVLPTICVAFCLLPWIRTLRWLRKVEGDLLRKHHPELFEAGEKGEEE